MGAPNTEYKRKIYVTFAYVYWLERNIENPTEDNKPYLNDMENELRMIKRGEKSGEIVFVKNPRYVFQKYTKHEKSNSKITQAISR